MKRAAGDRSRPSRAATAALVVLALLAGSSGCRKERARPQPAPVVPARVAVPLPPPPSPPPPPGDADLKEAAAALRRGDPENAAARLESVIALGDRAPGRVEALLTLAVLRARPDSPHRDIRIAQAHLRQVLVSRPSAPREAEAMLILSLLALEAEKEQTILDLRAQIDASKGESEGLKAALAQREEELRKIKDILLEKQPGP